MSSSAAVPSSAPQQCVVRYEELQERMEVMFWQERTHYRTVDYLGSAANGQPDDQDDEPPSSDRELGTMTPQWRARMCEWAYQLVDHFDLPREVVGTCMNFLDRYLSGFFESSRSDVPAGISKKRFQLVTVTCLYLAIKLSNCRQSISIGFMVKLSRNSITAEEVKAMESEVLVQLRWLVHPPTSFDFVKHYLKLLQLPSTSTTPLSCQRDQKIRALEESAAFFIELSVLDFFSVEHRPSTVALAALLNALDDQQQQQQQQQLADGYYAPGANTDLQVLLEQLKALAYTSEAHNVELCRHRLASLYGNTAAGSNQSPASPIPSQQEQDLCKASRMTSPVSVMQQ